MEEAMSEGLYRLPGERLSVWRIENNISIHTNGRALAIDLAQATALRDALQAVLPSPTGDGIYDRASTDDYAMPQSPTPAPTVPREASVRQSKAIPNLEDI
jgi:hypothetical protein